MNGMWQATDITHFMLTPEKTWKNEGNTFEVVHNYRELREKDKSEERLIAKSMKLTQHMGVFQM